MAETKRENPNLIRRIDRALDREDWSEARQLIQEALKAEPDHHWLLTRLSTTFYEQRRYKQALKISERAVRLVPACPLVLWDYANALDMTCHEKKAVEIWKRLLRRGAKAVGQGECGEGIPWARSLLNDCRYRIGKCLAELGDRAGAVRFMRFYLKYRERGVGSIYSPKEVESLLTCSVKMEPH